jgi:hypothetical protein
MRSPNDRGPTHVLSHASPWCSYAVTFASAIRESNSAPSPTVAVATNLGVALAENDWQTLYLRTFFRLLSSRVHGEKSWSRSRLPTTVPVVGRASSASRRHRR